VQGDADHLPWEDGRFSVATSVNAVKFFPDPLAALLGVRDGEGDGHDCAFGVDYTEWGIVKYLRREGAPELAPDLGWIDYPQFAAVHLRLVRAETIAQGGQKCVFRLGLGKLQASMIVRSRA
jgi:hypothetical protein